MILVDYLCTEPSCGLRFESLEHRPFPEQVFCPTCFGVSNWTPSPVATHMPVAWAVSTGKSDPKPPGIADTEPLADGMKMSEWRKVQDKAADERRRAWIKRVT